MRCSQLRRDPSRDLIADGASGSFAVVNIPPFSFFSGLRRRWERTRNWAIQYCGIQCSNTTLQHCAKKMALVPEYKISEQRD